MENHGIRKISRCRSETPAKEYPPSIWSESYITLLHRKIHSLRVLDLDYPLCKVD